MDQLRLQKEIEIRGVKITVMEMDVSHHVLFALRADKEALKGMQDDSSDMEAFMLAQFGMFDDFIVQCCSLGEAYRSAGGSVKAAVLDAFFEVNPDFFDVLGKVTRVFERMGSMIAPGPSLPPQPSAEPSMPLSVRAMRESTGMGTPGSSSV